MLRFGGHFTEKMALKLVILGILLLEGAIFIVGIHKLATNDFIRMSMIIKCFVLV